MMTSKIAFHRRVAWRITTLAAVAIAAAMAIAATRNTVAWAGAESAVSAQTGSAPPGANVRIESVGTQRDGITGQPRIGRPQSQTIGQTVTRYVRAGEDQRQRVCDAGIRDIPFSDYLFQWKVDARLVRISAGRTTLRVHWTRTRATSPDPEREETRTITVGPGETHVLDFVENPDVTDSCASLIVQISAEPILSVSAQPLSVELWTVDGSDGAERSVYKAVRARSGQLIEYALPALDIAPTRGSAPDGAAITMDVRGQVVATLDGDGFVNIVLDTKRRSISDKGSVGGEGHVEFRAKVGEAAEVVLPDPVGSLPLSEGGARVDLARVFAGHRTSLYVKVTVAQ